MPTGTVKRFFKEKGYGFITPDDGTADIFAPTRSLASGDEDTVREGLKVTFEAEIETRTNKPKAVRWSIIDTAALGLSPDLSAGMSAAYGGALAQSLQQPMQAFAGLPGAAGYGAAMSAFGALPQTLQPAQAAAALQQPLGYETMPGLAAATAYGAIPGTTPGVDRFSPYGAGAPVPATAPVAAAPVTLPAGWEQANDPTSGKAYYFNRATGETSWTPPAGAVAAAAPAAAVPATAPVVAPAPAAVVPAVAAAGAQAPALPPGWESAADPNSGKTYYFNRGTGETSWSLPTAAPVAAA